MKNEKPLAASQGREDQYVSKQYSAAEQLVFGAKAGAAMGLVVLVIWLLDKYL